MELELNLSDSMNTMRDYKLVRVVRRVVFQIVRVVDHITVSEFRAAHCLLLAQALAVSFYGLKQGCV
jgi:hypothetical protein